MINYNTYVNDVLQDLARQKDQLIVDQLGDLLERGLLVVEQTQPVLVQSYDKNKIELKQSVRLVLKDKEYIERLEKENIELKSQVEFYQKHHLTPLIPTIENLVLINQDLRDRINILERQ